MGIPKKYFRWLFPTKVVKENETPFYNDKTHLSKKFKSIRLMEEVNLSSTFTWSTYVIIFGALGILALRDRAKAALTTLALAQEESLGDQKPADDLLNLSGLERSMAFKLAARGVCTLEDLAEQGVDDLADIEGLSDEQAGELIMAARNICWFGDNA